MSPAGALGAAGDKPWDKPPPYTDMSRLLRRSIIRARSRERLGESDVWRARIQPEQESPRQLVGVRRDPDVGAGRVDVAQAALQPVP